MAGVPKPEWRFEAFKQLVIKLLAEADQQTKPKPSHSKKKPKKTTRKRRPKNSV
jgi:hypothetical protein